MIQFSNNSKINISGKEYKILFSQRRLMKERVLDDLDKLIVYQSELKNTKHQTILLKYLRELAKKKITSRTIVLAERYGFQVRKITVRDQSSRWGSCSSAKNINLNWRLIFAPRSILDYVIIHELCHTRQMNHSRRFWDLVESIMPSWREKRNWLREYSSHLEIKAEK